MNRWEILLFIAAQLVVVGVLTAAALMYSSDASPIGYLWLLLGGIGVVATTRTTPETVSPEGQP